MLMYKNKFGGHNVTIKIFPNESLIKIFNDEGYFSVHFVLLPGVNKVIEATVCTGVGDIDVPLEVFSKLNNLENSVANFGHYKEWFLVAIKYAKQYLSLRAKEYSYSSDKL